MGPVAYAPRFCQVIESGDQRDACILREELANTLLALSLGLRITDARDERAVKAALHLKRDRPKSMLLHGSFTAIMNGNELSP